MAHSNFFFYQFTCGASSLFILSNMVLLHLYRGCICLHGLGTTHEYLLFLFCFNWEVSEIGCCTCTLCLYSELSGSVKPMYFVCWLCMERCGLRLGGMENLAHSSLLELLTSYGCSRCLASLCGMACFGGHFLFKTPWTNSPLPSVIALSLEE